jgi:hypothetical protein
MSDPLNITQSLISVLETIHAEAVKVIKEHQARLEAK